MKGSSVSWEVRILEGRAAVDVPRLAAEIGADLVIAATHARSGWKRALIGSVTEDLVHHLEAPLLSVPPAKGSSRMQREFAPRKIVLGCDFSPDSMQAVSHAAALAQEYRAELHLVHVLEPSIYRTLERSVAELALRLEEAVRGVVQMGLRELLPPEVSDSSRLVTAVLSGAPHAEILRYASDIGADLIVLGVRGHKRLPEILVGSTTDRVIRHAPCPILTVRKEAVALPECEAGSSGRKAAFAGRRISS